VEKLKLLDGVDGFGAALHIWIERHRGTARSDRHLVEELLNVLHIARMIDATEPTDRGNKRSGHN
jgi:hypothetical protein